MQISIASFSFHRSRAAGTIDIFGYLESCRYRYHLATADIWNGLLGSDPNQYLDESFLAKVKHAMQERNLELVNYHADGCHIWEDDATKREQNAKLAERHIAAAEFLGAKTVRIDAGSRAKEWTTQQFDAIAERYRAWSRRGADRGYRIGPENHFGPEKGLQNMLRLAEAVDHAGYGVLLHLGRWEDSDGEAGDRAMTEYAMHAHVDASVASTRLNDALKVLRDSGYRGCIGVECPTSAAELEYAEVEKNVALVRRALAATAAHAPTSG
jgi:sugar phosphate isomerase/epimerase